MKNYKKGLLALSIISAIPLVVANTVQDDSIRVTTFADEDGENLAACSLREAITAAKENKPYGGCSAGKINSSVTDNIILEKGEYILNRPLVPGSQINLSGGEMTDWSKKDAVTGVYPARLQPTTTIKGNNTFSLFDTSLGKATITLNNLTLLNGGGRQGGAIYSGGAVTLNKVEIRNSSATEVGGAIYLAGVGSALQANDSIFENNQAPKGAVIAMSCSDNLGFTKRSIEFYRSSILNNGNANTQQVMEFCGNAKVELVNNTITLNHASATQGSIIKYTADSRPNTDQHSILSGESSLLVQNNTIINNTAYASLLFDSIGSKSIQYNILAYNNGHSCRHLLGEFTETGKGTIGFGFNAVNKIASSKDYCYLPYPDEDKTENKTDTTIDLSKIPQNSILQPLLESSKFSAFMPIYFLNASSNNPLVNIKSATSCAKEDQRNKTRILESDLILETEAEKETCDVGAVERTRLRAADLQGMNTSLVTLMDGFEANRDFFKELAEDPNVNPDFKEYYQIRYKEYEDMLTNYPKSMKYRQIYYDIFSASQPHEIINSQGASEILQFDQDAYKVEVVALGIGVDVFTSKKAEDLPQIPDPNLKCEWDANIKRVLMYRTDGEIDQAGDFGYCKYTISLKTDAQIKSSGVLQGSFVNISPIAVDDQYTLRWGTDQRVRLDLLANDHDNGDGKPDVAFYPKGKSIFYVGEDGISAPIKIGKIDNNLKFEAQYQMPCPDESGAICYGGEMYIAPKNSYNKFNYSFTYSVFDSDAGISNEATVRLISTATNSEDTRKGGGGSLGLLGVFGLGALAYLRRKVSKTM